MSLSRSRAAGYWRRFTRTVAPSATNVIITITLLVFLAQLIFRDTITGALQYAGAYSIPSLGAPFEPWRMLTVALVHSPGFILHVFFNMLALFMFGPQLEAMIGKWRFVALYVLSTFGGSVAVLYLANPLQPVVGASGAIFGLLGAFFVIARKSGANTTGLVVMIALNLAIGFYVGTVSWQAHIGGLITGGVVAFVLTRTPRRTQLQLQRGLLALVAAVLVILSLLPLLLGR